MCSVTESMLIRTYTITQASMKHAPPPRTTAAATPYHVVYQKEKEKEKEAYVPIMRELIYPIFLFVQEGTLM